MFFALFLGYAPAALAGALVCVKGIGHRRGVDVGIGTWLQELPIFVVVALVQGWFAWQMIYRGIDFPTAVCFVVLAVVLYRMTHAEMDGLIAMGIALLQFVFVAATVLPLQAYWSSMLFR